MYIIKLDGRRYNSKSFRTYEEARSYVRKKLRSSSGPMGSDVAWLRYANPSISTYGFKIEKRAA